ncbi:MAG: diacylglycerol/lipid kinase family protein [Candidatus Aminicenantaceae bacterium]
MGKENIISIVNPEAANRKWLRKKRLSHIIRRNIPGILLYSHGNKEYTSGIVRKEAKKNDKIIAIGGDGTIVDVIQGIICSRRQKNIQFGIVPFGSGNAFRRSLRIPKNIKKAVKIIKTGKEKTIDLMDIEGTAAVFASIGATAKITKKKLQHNIPGLLGHLFASRILTNMNKELLKIELYNGKDDRGRTFKKKILELYVLDCIIGKSKYYGYNWKIAPKAELDDGYLDVSFFEISSLKYLLGFPFIYMGLYQKNRRHYKAKKVITYGKSLSVQYNGEYFGERTKFEFNVLPQALKVIIKK